MTTTVSVFKLSENFCFRENALQQLLVDVVFFTTLGLESVMFVKHQCVTDERDESAAFICTAQPMFLRWPWTILASLAPIVYVLNAMAVDGLKNL